MNKGTILYVGGFELPDKNAAAHRVLNNGKIFKNLDYKVVFIDIDKTLDIQSDILNTKKNVQEFDCWSLPYPKKTLEWFNFLTSIKNVILITKLYKDVKIIIAYNYPAIALNNLRLFGKKNRIKIIGDCTEWYSTVGTSITFKIIKGLDTFIRMRIIQKKLDGLIVISTYLKKYYKKCLNVVVIPPLIDRNENKWKIDQIYSLSNEQLNKVKLIYSGNPGKNKDKIIVLIDALYNLLEGESYQLKIIGISQKQFIYDYPKYKCIIEEMEDKIVFKGKLTHEESLRELQNSDYSIFIRDKTRLNNAGFPTKFVESITCGVPVITNDTSDLYSYIIDESYGVIVKDCSVNELKSALSRILVNKTIYKSSKMKINNKVFDYTGYIKIMQELFENLYPIN